MFASSAFADDLSLVRPELLAPTPPPVTRTRAYRTSRIINLALTSGVATWFFVESVGYTPAKDTLDPVAYAHDEQHLNGTFGTLAPILMASTTASSLPMLWINRHHPTSPAFLLTAGGLALDAGAVLSTLFINVPANSTIGSWDPNMPPSDWQTVRDRWETGANIRMGLMLGSLACQIAAALVE